VNPTYTEQLALAIGIQHFNIDLGELWWIHISETTLVDNTLATAPKHA